MMNPNKHFKYEQTHIDKYPLNFLSESEDSYNYYSIVLEFDPQTYIVTFVKRRVAGGLDQSEVILHEIPWPDLKEIHKKYLKGAGEVTRD